MWIVSKSHDSKAKLSVGFFSFFSKPLHAIDDAPSRAQTKQIGASTLMCSRRVHSPSTQCIRYRLRREADSAHLPSFKITGVLHTDQRSGSESAEDICDTQENKRNCSDNQMLWQRRKSQMNLTFTKKSILET